MCVEDHLPASYGRKTRRHPTPAVRFENAAIMLRAIAQEVGSLPIDAGRWETLEDDVDTIRRKVRTAGPSGHPKSCEHCGTYYESVRADSRYCTGRCRTAASRIRRQTPPPPPDRPEPPAAAAWHNPPDDLDAFLGSLE